MFKQATSVKTQSSLLGSENSAWSTCKVAYLSEDHVLLCQCPTAALCMW